MKFLIEEFAPVILVLALFAVGSASAKADEVIYNLDGCSAAGFESIEECKASQRALLDGVRDADGAVNLDLIEVDGTTLEIRLSQEGEFRSCMDMQLGVVSSLNYAQAMELKESHADVKVAVDTFAPYCRRKAGIKG